MNSAQEAVEALCRLSASDRDWILSALSSNARKRLRELAAAEHRDAAGGGEEAAPRESAGNPAEEALSGAAPTFVISRLGAEPAWMLALVLNVRKWPWQEALLSALPPDKRFEVAQLRARLPRPSSRMHEALLRALTEQLSSVTTVAERDALFEVALGRARLRTRRRG